MFCWKVILQYPTGLSYSGLRPKFVDLGNRRTFVAVGFWMVLRAQRELGLHIWHAWGLGMIFSKKSFFGVFPRKISHLWWPSRPEIWRTSRKSPKIRIFRRPRTIFPPNRWKKFENQKFLTTSTKYAYEPQAYQK